MGRAAARGGGGAERGVVERIERAIARGAPTYNSGDHTGCYEIYVECCQDLLGSLSGARKQMVVASLERAATMRSGTDQAWELRRTLDALAQDPPPASEAVGGGALGAVLLAEERGGGGGEEEREEREGEGGGGRWEKLFDFGEKEVANGFRSLNDGVMGGRSSGAMGWDEEEGCGLYAGELSTANSGGFSSVLIPTPKANLPDARGLWIEYKSDGQQYKLQVRRSADSDVGLLSMFTGGGNDGVVYQADLPGPDQTWTTAFIPFQNFRPSWRGQPRSAPDLTGTQLKSVSLMVSKLSADGSPNPSFRPGPFALRVRAIGAYY